MEMALAFNPSPDIHPAIRPDLARKRPKFSPSAHKLRLGLAIRSHKAQNQCIRCGWRVGKWKNRSLT
jgi:hypothetical protein